VNGVVVLLVDGADKLEVTNLVALCLFRAEEGDGSLGGHGGTNRHLTCGDENETVTLGLPGEVDDGILDGVNDLDGHTLFSDAEDLEVGGHGLLALAVTIDLDTEVGGVALPVKLCVGNVEQVTGTDDLLGGDAHDTDLCGVATHLRGPVTEELLVGLDTLTVGSSGAPFEVLDLVDLD
jgi:hypothetical protein